MATESTDTELTPVPLDLMLRHAVEGSPDYDDGIGGWVSGRYESETGILTLRYERDGDMRPEFVAESEDYQHSTTEYRFKLIPEIVSDAAPGFDADAHWDAVVASEAPSWPHGSTMEAAQ